MQENIVIIGAGKLGTSLFELMGNEGCRVSLVSRKHDPERIKKASIIILCVPDAEIPNCLDNLLADITNSTIVTHCSGSEGSDILAGAREKNCFIASTHPFNTFPSLEASRATLADTNHNTWMFAEGDLQALEVLGPLFGSLGFKVRELSSQNKALYHAACVTVCNYLVSLMDVGLDLAEGAGLSRDEFWQASLPIVEQTLGNISQHGSKASLSGPIARGDLGTIEKHLAEIEDSNQLKIYRSLGENAAGIALENNQISADIHEKIIRLLTLPS